MSGGPFAMGTAAGETLRALGVGAGFLLVFAAAEVWKRRCAPPVECTRKLVHFGGGLIVAAFPWRKRTHGAPSAVDVRMIQAN